MNRLLEEYEKEHKKEITDETILEKISEANSQKVHIAKSKSGIVVKGIDDMAVRFSKCCNPVPGDEIVGFVSPGTGECPSTERTVSTCCISQRQSGSV